MTDTAELPVILKSEKKHRSMKDLPGFDITVQEMLKLIELPCMVFKLSQESVLQVLTLSLTGDTLSAISIDVNAAQVESRLVIDHASGDMVASVPASHITALVMSMSPDTVISVRCNKAANKLVISVGKGCSYRIPLCKEPLPYIDLKRLNSQYSIKFPASLLLNSLQRVIHCAASDDVRDYMNGVYLALHDGLLDTVATNGFRMSISSLPVTYSDNPAIGSDTPVAPLSMASVSAGVIIPLAVCPLLIKLLNSTPEVVTLHYSEHHLFCHFDSTTVVVSLIDAKYPEWARIEHQTLNNEHVFSINIRQVKSALSRALPVLQESYLQGKSPYAALLSFRDDAMLITSTSKHTVSFKEVIGIKRLSGTANDNLSIAINADYLNTALSSLAALLDDDADVVLAMRDSDTGVLIRASDLNRDIIMPMKL